MTRCNELRLVFTMLTSLLIGIQADVKTDKYEYDGNKVVPKNVTGCQDGKTGILLFTIKISRKSLEIALLPHGIKNTGQLELWTEFANRCNGKRQCQMNLLKNMMDKVFPSPDTNTTIEMEFFCKPTGGDNAYRIVKNFSKVIKKGGKFSVYLMYNETSENNVVCFVNTDTERVDIEVLHFEWRPPDCLNPNYNITVYRQAFYCSWTNRKKTVIVPSPQNIEIKFLQQTGFVWIEVQTEVADSRYTTLNLTCNLVPSTTLSPEISVTNRNLQTVASTASPTASKSISTRNYSTTTTTRSHPKLTKMPIITKTPITTNTPPMVTLTTTDMGTAPETTSNTSSLSSAPDKREASKSKVANFNDQYLPVIITLCVLLTIAVAVILFLAYKLKERNRRSPINVYSTTKGSNQDIHLYNDTVDLNQYETVREASPNTYNNQLSNVFI